MALVKVLSNNLFAGAGFQRLEAGKIYDVDKAIAEKWITAGSAEASDSNEGALRFEVSTPSPLGVDYTSGLQKQLDNALEQLKKAQSDAEAKDKEHADALEQLKKEHAEALAAATKRADGAEAALADATKKVK